MAQTQSSAPPRRQGRSLSDLARIEQLYALGKITDWKSMFLTDICDHEYLTDKQAAVCNRIKAKVEK
jgi:hypothetical protein